MSAEQTPRVANWLLVRLASGPKRESLIGDLDEQFTHGRSSFWYWRQVVSAILLGAVRDCCEHKLLAIRSGTVTVVVGILWVELTWAFHIWITSIFASTAWAATAPDHLVNSSFWIWYGGGLQQIWWIGAALIGWFNVRRHAEQSAAMLLVSVVSVAALGLWWGGPWLVNAFQTPAQYRLYQMLYAMNCLVGLPLCTFLGGLSGTSSTFRTCRTS